MTPDLVLLGNLIVDDIVLPDGATRRGEPGGAMLYAALGASVWGARVAVVAPVGDDYPRAALAALETRGVDLSRLRPLGRPGLRTWLHYERPARRVIHQPGSPTHDEASPRADDLAALSGARAFHIAPIPQACQQRLVKAVADRPGALVSLDPHDPITEQSLDGWRETLAGVDLLFASEEEVRLDGVDADPARALRRVAPARMLAIALKRGARGGLLYDARADRSLEWSARAESVVDPTGAGDAFAGGFLSGWLAGESPEDSIIRGVVAASFALESWGAAALMSATREDAERRRAAWFGAAGSGVPPETSGREG